MWEILHLLWVTIPGMDRKEILNIYGTLYMVYYLKCERQCLMFKVACVVKIKLFFYGLVLL